MKFLIPVLLLLLAGNASAQCPDVLLVSGYFSGNVHRFDACTGAFEGLLDPQGRLAGAQASRVGPDGRLYVVAEDRNRIERYDARTLAHVDTAVVLPALFGAIGIVFSGNEIWVASYTGSRVWRYDLATGASLGQLIASGAAGLHGADNGMMFGPDGQLYVPGFDSHNVVRHDPASGMTTPFILPQSGGLRHTRGILFEPDGSTVLVSSEGTGKVLRYAAADGAFIGEVVGGMVRPAGLAYHADGSLLVAHAAGVSRVNAATGEVLGLLASASAGLLNWPTYVTVLPRGSAVAVDDAQIGSQYWVSGAGPMVGNVIDVADMVSSVGGAFGLEFDPDQIVRKRWGSARITFTSCTRGELSWNASGPASAGFGAGAYPIQRLLPSEATRRCEAEGFATVESRDWVAGSWYGGPARDGEGLMLDLNTDGIAFLTWFTYRPR